MKKDTAWLLEKPVAHRGLHDNKTIPENSIAAYKNAVDHGYPIEFDVHLTNDNKLVLHHDPILLRTCGYKTRVTRIDSNHLENYKLFGTQECIPTFDQILETVDGKVGLIIEIKKTRRPATVCKMIMERLSSYKGKYCIESFDINVVNYMHKHYPDVILGQLYDYIPFQRWAALSSFQHLKVDFMAVCILNGKYKKYLEIRKKHPELLFVAWTIRTKEQEQLAKEIYDNYIFECNIKNPEYINMPTITQ